LTSSFETNSHCQDILCALTDVENSENHKINMILYHYAKAIKSVIAEPDFLELIITPMLEDANSIGTPIHQLASENPIFAEAIDNALRVSIENETVFPHGIEDFDSILDISQYLGNAFTYGDDQYQPVVSL